MTTAIIPTFLPICSMRQTISKTEYHGKVLLNGLKLANYRLQRFIGYPEREVHSRHIDTNRICCPNIRVVRKYIPSLGRLVDLPVPCGRCMWCRHKNQNKLIFRMYQHCRVYNNCLYLTLTYDEQHVSSDSEVLRSDITKWLKRVRKFACDKTISYYYVCEKGDLFKRPHFHVLLFWNGLIDKVLMASICTSAWKSHKRTIAHLSDLYDIDSLSRAGNVYVDYCNTTGENDVSTAILSYVSKYVSDNTKHLLFRSWSHHLGYDILSVDMDLVNKLMYLRCIEYMPKDKVYSVAIPQYYKNILFSDAERACFFNDYLLSDEYKDMMSLTFDENRINQVSNAYEKYKQRCENAYRARLKKKREKYFRDTGKLILDS